jgi:hypothetical protein
MRSLPEDYTTSETFLTHIMGAYAFLFVVVGFLFLLSPGSRFI